MEVGDVSEGLLQSLPASLTPELSSRLGAGDRRTSRSSDLVTAQEEPAEPDDPYTIARLDAPGYDDAVAGALPVSLVTAA